MVCIDCLLMEQHPSPSSPRRKNPPLNLDAALFLQSQASYVQEPNKSTSQANAEPPATPTRSLSRPVNQSPYRTGPTTTFFGARMPSMSVDYQTQDFQKFYYGNNISVDYIDCLSNNDLSPPSREQNAPRSRMMPNCKKHLKFHRNRVEPSSQQARYSSGNIQTSKESLASNHQQNSPSPGETSPGSALGSPRRQAAFDLSEFETSSQTCTDGTQKRPEENEGVEPTTSSVLYPISVSEVKKRTYFIGSLNQESLLGEDELLRYFPNGRVSIFVCTWNQNRKRAPVNICDLLLPDQVVCLPDIYAIGIQEAFSSQSDYLREWEIELQVTLGPSHVLLRSCSLGVLHLCLFIRRDLIWFCSTPEESLYNSRSMPTNMTKTKGAVSIAFRFFGTSFMFTNCHFPAHENRLKDRVDEYQRVINSIDLPKDLKLLKPRYLSNDSTARFDCVFFMGDLNFRLEQRSFDETIHILEDIFQQKEPTYESLTLHDELLKVMESGQAFHGFDEGQIKFPPTFKFLAQTNKYDRQTKRVPSYTDRILFRSKRQRHIQCLTYDWLPHLMSSDHKPVYCLFDVLVRPGHQQQDMVATLNAGLFQRNIYLEAMKRRANDPSSMRENGSGGTLICSIQ